MTTPTRSVRHEQRELVASLRHQHKDWRTIARTLSETYSLNMRVSFRLAHGWSQREVADRWNERWPAEPKTFKNFSYWENWPSKTGYEPSLDVLARLAEMYECSASDLLSDYADFSHRDGNSVTSTAANHVAPADSRDSAPQAASRSSLDALLESPGEFDIHELAAACMDWVRGLNDRRDRRELLLKLSAALTLASASPDLAPATVDAQPRSIMSHEPERLSGIWHSHYSFPSSGRAKAIDGEHYVVLRQRDRRLTGQSLPHSQDSRLRLDLFVDGSVVTGTWSERTSPDGYYRGATYHGAIQVLLDPRGRMMSGKWIGFDKEFNVNAGDWSLTWIDGSTSQRAMRGYHLKA